MEAWMTLTAASYSSNGLSHWTPGIVCEKYKKFCTVHLLLSSLYVSGYLAVWRQNWKKEIRHQGNMTLCLPTIKKQQKMTIKEASPMPKCWN